MEPPIAPSALLVLLGVLPAAAKCFETRSKGVQTKMLHTPLPLATHLSTKASSSPGKASAGLPCFVKNSLGKV